jgi:cytochrome P450 family 135
MNRGHGVADAGGALQLPPGPRMPSGLQTLAWARRPLAFLEAAHERYGDIFTLRIRRGSPWVVLADPEQVREVFTTAVGAGAGAAEANPLLGPLLGSRSVMLLDEPEHTAQRKLVLPSFHGERMRGYDAMIVEVARREIATWPVGEPFALWPRMQAISMEVVMRAVFGDSGSERLSGLRSSLEEMTAWLNEPRRLALVSLGGSRWLAGTRGFRAAVGPVEEAVLKEARRRRALGRGGEGEDMLSLLEQARDQRGAPMSDQELRDELITLLSDGPTATSLAWAFERLLRHPEKLARLRQEVLDGEQEQFAEAVVKETLRLCPSVPLVMRRITEPLSLSGYAIPAGTTVAPCPHLVHLRGDLYPEPREFRPERFLENAAGTYTWIPFGGGVRRCVAAGFAQLEMKRVIQTVLREVELDAVEGPAERARRSSVAFAPSEAGLVRISRRRSRSDAGQLVLSARSAAGG